VGGRKKKEDQTLLGNEGGKDFATENKTPQERDTSSAESQETPNSKTRRAATLRGRPEGVAKGGGVSADVEKSAGNVRGKKINNFYALINGIGRHKAKFLFTVRGIKLTVKSKKKRVYHPKKGKTSGGKGGCAHSLCIYIKSKTGWGKATGGEEKFSKK